MTALAQYERLEAQARYFDGETAAPREVIVKFGDASLIVLAPNDMPITHWSLAGLRDLGEGGASLSLAPGDGGDDETERLTIDDAEMVAAIRAVCPDLRSRPAVKRSRWARALLWAGGALGAVYLIIFHIAPALSDQLAALIPPEAEAAMGEQMAERFAGLFAEEGGAKFCATPQGDRALKALTNRLESGAGAHVPLVVRVLDHKMVNAFALPGGQIVVFRGLLDAADNPEELAGVLAHEIGHVAARDPTRLTLRSAGAAGLLGLLFGDFTGAAVTVALSEALLRSGYQREAEAAADDFAARLLGREGLPTPPLAAFFTKLAKKGRSGPSLLSHLSTHPDLAGRAAAMEAADTVGDAPFEPALSDQDWVALQSICG